MDCDNIQNFDIESAMPSQNERIAMNTGDVFVRDTSNAALGEAYRDPKGMIWGDIAKKPDGNPIYMTHAAATQYCENKGASLPTREDFLRLRRYLGYHTGDGYSSLATDGKDILPGLSGKWFWSSSVHPYGSDYAYFFSGSRGVMYYDHRVSKIAVRCVSSR